MKANAIIHPWKRSLMAGLFFWCLHSLETEKRHLRLREGKEAEMRSLYLVEASSTGVPTKALTSFSTGPREEVRQNGTIWNSSLKACCKNMEEGHYLTMEGHGGTSCLVLSYVQYHLEKLKSTWSCFSKVFFLDQYLYFQAKQDILCDV